MSADQVAQLAAHFVIARVGLDGRCEGADVPGEPLGQEQVPASARFGSLALPGKGESSAPYAGGATRVDCLGATSTNRDRWSAPSNSAVEATR